jgi:hypothetical protein
MTRMEVDTAKALLAAAAGDEELICLPPSVLSNLTVADFPNDVFVEVGVHIDDVIHLDWSGRLYREGEQIVGEADYSWTRAFIY